MNGYLKSEEFIQLTVKNTYTDTSNNHTNKCHNNRYEHFREITPAFSFAGAVTKPYVSSRSDPDLSFPGLVKSNSAEAGTVAGGSGQFTVLHGTVRDKGLLRLSPADPAAG